MAPDRRRAAASVALLALAVAAAPASAALYVCTAADGRTITSDRPPPECANLAIKELRPDGSVRRLIEPPLTEEQRRARVEKMRLDRLEQEARRTQARRDIALMETYASEYEIEAARQAALASRQAMIDRSKQRLESFSAERTKLEQEVEFYANRKLPAKLERAIESNKELTLAETRMIIDMEADMARINQRFDAELARFRALVLAGARPLVRTSDGGTR
jgi:Domain of unknown function (DUF4124)